MPLLNFLLLLENKLVDEHLLVNLVVLQTLLAGLHHEDRRVVPVFDELVFDALEHHVEPVFDIVFSPSGHFSYDFAPLVADRQPLLQDLNVLFQRKRVSFDFGVEKVHPPFSALFSISVDIKTLVKHGRNAAPLLGAVLSNKPNQLLVLLLAPITLLDG